MEEKELSIQDIISILLGGIKFIIIVTLLCTIGAWGVSKFVLPLEYTSSVKIYVKNSTTANDNAGVNYNDLVAAKSLAETYIVIMDDNAVYDHVSDRLIEDYALDDLEQYFNIRKDKEGNEYISPNQIRDMVSMSAVNNTEVIRVTCTSEVPSFSADICTYIYDYSRDLLKRVTQASSIENVSDAEIPVLPSGPNVKLITLLGFAAGLAISVIIVFIMNSLDNAVTDGEEIKARFNIPVLAEIPDIFMDEKGAGKYAKYIK